MDAITAKRVLDEMGLNYQKFFLIVRSGRYRTLSRAITHEQSEAMLYLLHHPREVMSATASPLPASDRSSREESGA